MASNPFQAVAGVPLPEAAQQVAVHSEKGIDAMVAVRFALPNNQVDTFVQQLGVSLKDGKDPFFGADVPVQGWVRKAPDGARGASGQVEGKAVKVRVDPGDDSSWVQVQVFTL